MNRREFMKITGITSIAGISEVWASSIAFLTEPQCMKQNSIVAGSGKWWLETKGDGIVVKLFDLQENCYIEIGIAHLTPSVDYVRAMAPRNTDTPVYNSFAEMFGF